MTEHTYCVHFISSDIKVYVDAVLGEIAVEKAVKKLERYGINPSFLKCKINFWRVE